MTALENHRIVYETLFADTEYQAMYDDVSDELYQVQLFGLGAKGYDFSKVVDTIRFCLSWVSANIDDVTAWLEDGAGYDFDDEDESVA